MELQLVKRPTGKICCHLPCHKTFGVGARVNRLLCHAGSTGRSAGDLDLRR